MDQAYLAAAPRGTIEIGELTALDNAEIALAQLPEVVVVAKRETATPTSRPCSCRRSWWLPSASRAWSRRKTAARSFRRRRSAPDSEGALLK